MIPHDLRNYELGAYFIAVGRALSEHNVSPTGLTGALRPGVKGRRLILQQMRDDVIAAHDEYMWKGRMTVARADEILAMPLWEAISIGPGDMKGCADKE